LFLARWNIAGRVLRPAVLKTSEKAPYNADELLERALAYWGKPALARARSVRCGRSPSARWPTPTATGRRRSTRPSSRTRSAI
jgi:hypothetical protein